MEPSTSNALYNCSLELGLPNSCKRENAESKSEWWRWSETKIDWLWIGKRLKEELEKHSHRRMKRALELAVAMACEHIELRLEHFKGSFEEMYQHVLDRERRQS